MFTQTGGSATDFPSTQLGTNAVVSHKAHFQINLESNEWEAFQPSIAILHEPSTTDALVYQVYFWSDQLYFWLGQVYLWLGQVNF